MNAMYLDLSIGVATIAILFIFYYSVRVWRLHSDKQFREMSTLLFDIKTTQENIIRHLLNPKEGIKAKRHNAKVKEDVA